MLREPDQDHFPTDEELLDAVIEVVRAEALRALKGQQSATEVGEIEGDAIRAATLTLVLLVRRKKEKLKKR